MKPRVLRGFVLVIRTKDSCPSGKSGLIGEKKYIGPSDEKETDSVLFRVFRFQDKGFMFISRECLC